MCKALTRCPSLPSETDDKMRAFAEQVFASDARDENVRDEISMFDIADDCPILHQEQAMHLDRDEDEEKRWVAQEASLRLFCFFQGGGAFVVVLFFARRI